MQIHDTDDVHPDRAHPFTELLQELHGWLAETAADAVDMRVPHDDTIETELRAVGRDPAQYVELARPPWEEIEPRLNPNVRGSSFGAG